MGNSMEKDLEWHYRGADLAIRKLPLGIHQANCYVVVAWPSQDALVIDTPDEPERILLACQGLRVHYVVITHAHSDHLGAFLSVQQGLKAPVAIHPAEADRLPQSPDRLLYHGDLLHVGTLSFQVIYTPGHSPGSICLLVGRHLFSGDTLFPKGPGHTRTPANFRQAFESIRQHLLPLPDDTLVYPGHGADTVLGREKEEIAIFSQRSWDPNLCGDVLWLGSQ